MTNDITVDTLVRFVPEWADGDLAVYQVIEDYDDQLIIEPVEWDGPLVPQELVRRNMLVKVENV